MTLSPRESSLVQRIAASRDRLLQDLELHVGIRTGGDNRPALDHTRDLLCARLQKLGATVDLVPAGSRPEWLYGGDDMASPKAGPPAAVCRRTGGFSANMPRILLSGHLDTVHDPSDSNPFKKLTVRADGKTATGPGCVDMKGGLVIAVAALEALDAEGIECAWSFIFNSDEETGSYWSEGALRAAAREHDIGLVFEPALPDGSLATRRPGSGQFMVETRGKSAHVGRDFASGVSAVTALARVLVRLAELPDPARGKILSVGPVQGGHATNVVPDLARAWGNVRYPDQAVADELEREVQGAAMTHGTLPSVEVRTSFNRPAKPCTQEVESLALDARWAAEDLGQKLPFSSTGGVCDGNILQDAGLPTIDTLGARGGGLHTPDEWIELASVVERCQLLAVLLSRLANEAGWTKKTR